MLQRFLDPAVLHGISGLDLVAKTVVDGFVSGLHRSPEFGFSLEFAEYRAYTPGDDLRHVDWNLFARTERCYLKRYRGETNTQLTVLLDASNSMKYASGAVTNTWSYNPGNPGDIVILRLMYDWPVIGGILTPGLSNQPNGSSLMVGTAVFKNEPY